MDFKVIDNFLEKKFFKILKDTITHEEFPWRRRGPISTYKKDEIDGGYFSYSFFNNYIENSEHYRILIIPILDKLKARSVIAVRANMTLTKLFEKETLNYHKDYEFGNTTAVFNLTSCNGGISLLVNKENIKIPAVENRIVIFNSDIYHATIKPTNADVKFVINLNYF